MKKSAQRKLPAVAPDRLQAIRRLAKAGKIDDALARVDELIARHPDFKPLYGLAWEIASKEDSYRCVARALDWTRASPHSQAAWEALGSDALRLGYTALALWANDRLNALQGEPAPQHEELDTPFGKMSFEAAVANDTARALMNDGRFIEAERVCAGYDHISLRNNAAHACFHRGDIAQALSRFEESWQREPRNLFALNRIIALRLWLQGRDAAAGLAAPLKDALPLRSDDASAKVAGLLMLGEWQAADAAWRESEQADFWTAQAFDGKPAALFDIAGVIVAHRVGDREALRKRCAQAAAKHPEKQDALRRFVLGDALQAELGLVPDLELTGLNYWFPQSWLNRLFDLRKLDDREGERRFIELCVTCTAHPDYLFVVAEFGGESGRSLARALLFQRAKAGDAAARAALLELLARPYGPDEERARLQTDMMGAGLLEKGATITMWLKGEKRTIRVKSLEIHSEPSPPTLPPDAQARLEKTHKLLAQERLKECLPILEGLIAEHPNEPTLYHNLAAIKEGLGHPDEEIEALFKKAQAIDNEYLFAISGLARLAVKRGEIDAAREMIAPLLERDSYHFTEWRSILLTQLAIAEAEKNTSAMLTVLDQLDDLRQRFE
jgi:predicted Zn-dependent protease